MIRLVYEILTYFFPNIFFKPCFKRIDDIINTKPELCKKCGGRCCIKCGCYYSPEDFGKITYQKLKKEISKGNIKIQYIHGKYLDSKKGVFILRVKNVGEAAVGKNLKSKCVFLTKEGCKLSFEDRPAGGKLLIPFIDDNGIVRCYNSYSLYDCCKEWHTYRRIVKKLVRYYRRKRS